MTAHRILALEALSPPLARADADVLVDETLAWLDVIRGRSATPNDEDREVRRAILSARDALLRASESAAPLDRFATEIGERASARVVAGCTPSEDDDAVAAVLRYGYELDESGSQNVLVDDPTCVPVQTLGGPLSVGPVTSDAPVPWTSVRPTSLSDADFERPWPDAPTRAYAVIWYADPLAAQGNVLVVQRVDGLWRVVYEQLVWIS